MTLQARIEEVSFLGPVIRITATVGGHRLSLDKFNRPGTPPPVGRTAQLPVAESDFIILAD